MALIPGAVTSSDPLPVEDVGTHVEATGLHGFVFALASGIVLVQVVANPLIAGFGWFASRLGSSSVNRVSDL